MSVTDQKKAIESPWPTAGGLIGVMILVLVLAFVADWRRIHPGGSKWLKPDSSDHIGAEYDTIAQAIRAGRGFSDPFRVETGPTAWMPPVLVYLTAGLYWITGDDRGVVVEVVVLFSFATVVFASSLLVGQSKRLRLTGLAIGILGVYLLADFYDLFQHTHDTWVIMLMLSLVWLGGLYLFKAGDRDFKELVVWGCLGGVAAMCSPVVGFTWAMLTVTMLLPWQSIMSDRDQIQKLQRWKPLVITALVSILMITPWTIRNRVMLGKWIPVKSNAVYEIWQSQVLDDDGVLDSESAWQHPWGNNGPQRREYVGDGEVEFIAKRWRPTQQSIVANPVEFATRIVNRWFAACVYYTPLSPSDENYVWPIHLRRLVFPLPFISLLVILWFRTGPLELPLRLTILIYLFYLAPYILVSYYDRYAAPLFFCKAMLVLYALDTIMSWNSQRRQASQLKHDSAMLVPSRSGFTLIELLVVISIIGIMVSLLMPAVQRARESARRVECLNRIRQLSLGVSMFHDSLNHVPHNGGPDAASTLQSLGGPNVQPFTEDLADGTHYDWGVGNPSLGGRRQTGSWAYSILPYIEQTAAYEAGDCDAPQPLFACPSRSRGPALAAINNGFANFQSGGIAMTKTDVCANNRLMPNRPRVFGFRDVLDGLSQTILLGEKSFDPTVQTEASWYWDEPIWLGGSKGTARSGLKVLPDRVGIEFKENWGSPHDGGAHFVFADGHVQFVTQSVDWQLLAATLSPRDNEVETIAE